MIELSLSLFTQREGRLGSPSHIREPIEENPVQDWVLTESKRDALQRLAFDPSHLRETIGENPVQDWVLMLCDMSPVRS